MSIVSKIIGVVTSVFRIATTSSGSTKIFDGLYVTNGISGGNVFYATGASGVRVADAFTLSNEGNSAYNINTNTVSVGLASNYQFGWSNTSGQPYQTKDTGLARAAAAVVRVTNGAGGDGWLQQSAARSRVSSAVTNVTITPAAITGLSATLIAGRKYTGRLVLYAAVPTSSDGIRIDFDGGTATMTSFIAQGVLSDDTSTRKLARTTALATDITDTDLNGDGLVVIEFGLVCNAAGTFIPRIAKEADAAGATLTIAANSFMWLEDMP